MWWERSGRICFSPSGGSSTSRVGQPYLTILLLCVKIDLELLTDIFDVILGGILSTDLYSTYGWVLVQTDLCLDGFLCVFKADEGALGLIMKVADLDNSILLAYVSQGRNINLQKKKEKKKK